MRHIISISGKDSLAAAMVQRAMEPNLPYEYLFCDVGMELPETYEWLRKVESSLGVALTKVGRSLEDVMTEQGILPSPNRRICTKYGKVFPIRNFIGEDEAVQYIGIRADEEDRTGGLRPTGGVTYRFPLVEHGIGIADVYGMLDDKDILPPSFFWQRLWDDVLDKLSWSKEYALNLRPWQKARLFSWRSRNNCFMCFYQRLYEWVGLLEHHPDLFAEAEAIEVRHGSQEARSGLRVKSLHLRPDGPLANVRNRADEIYQKHVLTTVRNVAAARNRHGGKVDDGDLLSLTSCGIYCGK